MSENYVALLGTKGGPAIRPGSSMPTSNFLNLKDYKIVIDCGLGVTKGLVDQNIELKGLSLIFITHLHSDHYLELGPLIHTAWAAGLNSVVEVWGPDGLQDYWDAFLQSMQADIDLRIMDEGRPDLRSLVHINKIEAGMVLKRDDLMVQAIHTNHPPLIDTFSLSFEADEKKVVFSGDTAPFSAMEEFARGADLLIHEAMLESALPALVDRIGNGSEKLMLHLLNSHTCAHDAAKTAAAAGVRQLALSHLIPADDPSYTDKDWQQAVHGIWSGPLYLGRDGLRIHL